MGQMWGRFIEPSRGAAPSPTRHEMANTRCVEQKRGGSLSGVSSGAAAHRRSTTLIPVLGVLFRQVVVHAGGCVARGVSPVSTTLESEAETTGWFPAVDATGSCVWRSSLSTRRIPKGPGRRPKSLARQRFMELLAQGVPLRVACLEVGVSRSADQISRNGTTVHRQDGTVKVVPPLEPLAVRPISPRFLSENERFGSPTWPAMVTGRP